MGVPHIAGQLNNDLYAVPVKRRSPKNTDEIDGISPDKERCDDNDLPPGWEKHEGKTKNFFFIIYDLSLLKIRIIIFPFQI